MGDGAEATLVRERDAVRYRINTEGLEPGNAYTVWFVVVNDPTACDASPCAPPQIIGDPTVDGQVTFAKDGEIARRDGTARFGARIKAGPLLDGWLPVQGLDDPMVRRFTWCSTTTAPSSTTSSARCSRPIGPAARTPAHSRRSSRRPPWPTASPGPNTCLLWQSAVFLPPAAGR